MTNIGNLEAKATLDASPFQRSLNGIRDGLKDTNKQLSFISSTFKGGAIGLAIRTVFKSLDKDNETIKDLSKNWNNFVGTFSNASTGLVSALAPALNVALNLSGAFLDVVGNIGKAARALTDFVGLTKAIPAAFTNTDLGISSQAGFNVGAKQSLKSNDNLLGAFKFGSNKSAKFNSDELITKNFFDPLIDATSKMTGSITEFNESLGTATSSIQNMIDGNLSSKGSEELNRILKDKFKNPWELTAKQMEQNQRFDSYYKMAGYSESDINEFKKNKFIYNTGERPNTKTFDESLSRAFDLIKKDAVTNQPEIQALLKRAEQNIESMGMMKALDEFKKFNQERLKPGAEASKVAITISLDAGLIATIQKSQGVAVDLKSSKSIGKYVGDVFSQAALAAGK